MEGKADEDGFPRLHHPDFFHRMSASSPAVGRQSIRVEQLKGLGLHGRLWMSTHHLRCPPVQAGRRVRNKPSDPTPNRILHVTQSHDPDTHTHPTQHGIQLPLHLLRQHGHRHPHLLPPLLLPSRQRHHSRRLRRPHPPLPHLRLHHRRRRRHPHHDLGLLRPVHEPRRAHPHGRLRAHPDPTPAQHQSAMVRLPSPHRHRLRHRLPDPLQRRPGRPLPRRPPRRQRPDRLLPSPGRRLGRQHRPKRPLERPPKATEATAAARRVQRHRGRSDESRRQYRKHPTRVAGAREGGVQRGAFADLCASDCGGRGGVLL